MSESSASRAAAALALALFMACFCWMACLFDWRLVSTTYDLCEDTEGIAGCISSNSCCARMLTVPFGGGGLGVQELEESALHEEKTS